VGEKKVVAEERNTAEKREPRRTQIYQLMPEVMKRVGVIPREHRNKEFRYKYRSIDDIQKALQPALCELGVTTGVQVRGHYIDSYTEEKIRGGQRRVFHARLSLDVMFAAPDGSMVVFTGAGEGLDYGGDKATNKAMVAAYKYAVTLGLAIPTEDTVDSDGDLPVAEPAAVDKVAEVRNAKTGEPPTRQLDTTQAKSPQSVGPDEPCLSAQQDDIKFLAFELGMDATDLKQIVQKRGVQTLAELSSSQADTIVAGLKRKRLEQEAAEVF
jgi:hypothetical protein